MSRIQNINYMGKSILFMDYKGIETTEVDGLLAESRPIIDAAPPKSLLLLSDFTDANYDTAITGKVRKFAETNTPYVKASALVGITGIKKIIYNGVVRFTGRKMQICENLEEAKKWLVAQ